MNDENKKLCQDLRDIAESTFVRDCDNDAAMCLLNAASQISELESALADARQYIDFVAKLANHSLHGVLITHSHRHGYSIGRVAHEASIQTGSCYGNDQYLLSAAIRKSMPNDGEIVRK